jgi:hypothetical protein
MTDAAFFADGRVDPEIADMSCPGDPEMDWNLSTISSSGVAELATVDSLRKLDGADALLVVLCAGSEFVGVAVSVYSTSPEGYTLRSWYPDLRSACAAENDRFGWPTCDAFPAGGALDDQVGATTSSSTPLPSNDFACPTVEQLEVALGQPMTRMPVSGCAYRDVLANPIHIVSTDGRVEIDLDSHDARRGPLQ